MKHYPTIKEGTWLDEEGRGVAYEEIS